MGSTLYLQVSGQIVRVKNKTIELVISSSSMAIFSARDRDVLLLLIIFFHVMLHQHILMKAGTAKDPVLTGT